jgi:Glyoxalase-like domain
MGYTLQLVIDCADPHPLAEWWAQTLGWTVEPQDEAFIESMVEQGQASQHDTARYRGRLVWRTAAAIHPDPEKDPDNGSPRIYFQGVPEPKVVKNRLHVDLRNVGEDRDAVVARLVERGATVVRRASQGPHSWVTLTDPQGNEFCV